MPDTPLIHFKRETNEPEGVTLATLNFNPHDLWIGIYWKWVYCDRCRRKHFNVWLILLPCFPVHIVFGGNVWLQGLRFITKRVHL